MHALYRSRETLEQQVEERTAELRHSLEEREKLQREIIEAQKQALLDTLQGLAVWSGGLDTHGAVGQDLPVIGEIE